MNSSFSMLLLHELFWASQQFFLFGSFQTLWECFATAAEPLYPDSTGKQKYNDDNVYFTGNSKSHKLTDKLIYTERSQLPPLHSFYSFLLISIAKDKTPCKLKYTSIFFQTSLFSGLFLEMLNNGNECSNHCI